MKRFFLAFCILLSTLSPKIGDRGAILLAGLASASVCAMVERGDSTLVRMLGAGARINVGRQLPSVEQRPETDSSFERMSIASSTTSSSEQEEEESEDDEESSIGDTGDSQLLGWAVPLTSYDDGLSHELRFARTPSQLESDRLKRPPRIA